MRGEQRRSEGLFSYIRLEERVASDHPLRAILALVNEVLAALSGRFEELYSHTGRPSIAPEYLLRATLLQAFFTIRSERQLMEQIDYNLLFRWFVGLSIDDVVWDASVFSKNRDRLLEAEVAREFLSTLLSLPKVKRLLSSDHFSVDGTLIDAWASMKSFRPKDGSGAETDASVHDSQMLDDVLDKSNTGADVWADSAYRSAEIEAKLEARGYKSRVHRWARRNRPLSRREQAGNTTRSRVRARVEHVFGHQHTSMGGTIVRTIGIVRARAKIGLMNLVYNISRLVQLERVAAAPA